MKGFSLIELIVVVAILGLLLVTADPLTQSFQKQNNLQSASFAYAQTLRRATVLSQAVASDTAWGVVVATSTASSSIILFKGATYAVRDQNYDEVFPISLPLSVSGLSEIDFNKLSGFPKSSGTTTFTSGTYSHSIFINAKGTVTY